MSVTLYVPRDAVALGLGANKVARALFAGAERRGLDVTIVRTGSRGLFWLEPMVVERWRWFVCTGGSLVS